jgi:phosphoglycolate phosphatase
MNLIIFDCDGTIVDSQHVIVAAMERAFADAGLNAPPRAEILGVVGLSLVPAISQLLALRDGGVGTRAATMPTTNADPELARRMADSYKLGFQHLRRDPANHEPLYAGARTAIEALAARDDVVLGIATGKSRRGVDVLFERERLGHLFATIQTADDHPSKPHPSMLLRALEETGASAADAVMIGDTTYDITMARSANVLAIGVGWGYHENSALTAAGAAVVLDDYGQLCPALDALHFEQRYARSGAA